MWQVIAAAQALLTGQLPSVPHFRRKTSLQISEGQTQNHSWKQAVVSTCGLNQQTAGLRLIKQV